MLDSKHRLVSKNDERKSCEKSEPEASLSNPKLVTRVFRHNNGIRLIWSLLGFFAFAILLAQIAKPVLRLFLPPASEMMRGKTEQPVLVTLISEWVTFIVLTGSAWIMSRIERRPFSSYGLNTRQGFVMKDVVAGAVCGALSLSFLAILLWLSGSLIIERVLLPKDEIFWWGLLWAVAFVGVGCAGEFLSRGYLQYTISRAIERVLKNARIERADRWNVGFWCTAVMGSFLFGAAHSRNLGESPIGLISAACIGLVLACSLWRTGALWWAIGFHAAWDWAESFLWGVSNSGGLMEHRLLEAHPEGVAWLSGGSTGPEGSILVFPVIALTFVAIVKTTSGRHA